jgi:hypothetical protein
MSPFTVCIGFIQLAGASTALPPPNIQALIQERLEHQWRQRLGPNLPELRFDDTTCDEQGSYHYTERSLILNADTSAWRGPLEISLTSLVDGGRIPLERVTRTETNTLSKDVSRDSISKNALWSKWLPWSLLTVGAVVGVWVWHERETHIKELRGLAIRF